MLTLYKDLYRAYYGKFDYHLGLADNIFTTKYQLLLYIKFNDSTHDAKLSNF